MVVKTKIKWKSALKVEDSILQFYTKETAKMKLQIKSDSEVSNLSSVRVLHDLESVPTFSEL